MTCIMIMLFRLFGAIIQSFSTDVIAVDTTEMKILAVISVVEILLVSSIVAYVKNDNKSRSFIYDKRR